jgi:hypothetical protein
MQILAFFNIWQMPEMSRRNVPAARNARVMTTIEPSGIKSNYVVGSPAISRPQGWREGAPPPSAADGLDPVRSPVMRFGMRSVGDRAPGARSIS